MEEKKIETRIIDIDEKFDEAINHAKKIFFEGGCFVYPTDTIYGFGANPFNQDALDKIAMVKNRDLDKKYIMLVDGIQTLMRYVEIERDSHLDFLLSIWPNPISIVLKLNPYYSKILGANDAAFRVPFHTFSLKLLRALNMPLISTSVNRRAEEPMIDPTIIIQEFRGEIDAIYYSKNKMLTAGSTLINLMGDEPRLLRQGSFNFDDIMKRFYEKSQRA